MMEVFALFNTRWWVIVGGVAIQFVLGALWYGPFFGEKWMKANSLSAADISGGNVGVYLGTAVLSVVITFGLVFVLNAFRVETVAQGFLVVFLVWATLDLAPFIVHAAFEQRPKILILITAVENLVAWLLISILVVIS